MVKKCVTVSLIVCLLLVIAGCIGQSEKTERTRPPSSETVKYDAEGYIAWVEATCDIMEKDKEAIEDAMRREDYHDLEVAYKNWNDHATKAILEEFKYNPTPELTDLRREFHYFLQYSKEASQYGEIGARNHDAEYLGKALEYTDIANEYLDKALEEKANL